MALTTIDSWNPPRTNYGAYGGKTGIRYLVVVAIAAVVCGVLLWAWFALGFNHVDDPLDLIVAIAWWLAVAAVVGGIVWAEGKRREKMRLAFVGEGVACIPEAGLVMPDAGALASAGPLFSSNY